MSIWINIEWNKKNKAQWENNRVKGKKRYIVNRVSLYWAPYYFCIMMLYFYQTYSVQWREEGGFWFTAITLLIGGILSGTFFAKWEWDVKESSYLKHFEEQPH